MISLNIDSYPLNSNLINTTDYSGIQLYSLLETSLFDLIKADRVTIDKNQNISFSLHDLYWSDGTSINAEHYIQGITTFLKKNVILKNLFLHLFEGIKLEKKNITFITSSSSLLCLEFLKIPNFVPLTHRIERVFSGNLELTSFSKKKYFLSPHKYQNKSNQQVEIEICKSPSKNITNFLSGTKDVTCDTAFPAKKLETLQYSEFYQKQHCGLFAFIEVNNNFLKRANGKLLPLIKATISKLRIKEIESLLWERTSTFSNKSRIDTPVPPIHLPSINKRELKNQVITISYHDFYPNQIVCEYIKEALQENAGLKCELIKRDYYNSSINKSDLTFNISYFISNSQFIRYSLMQMIAPNKVVYKKLIAKVIKEGFMSDEILETFDIEISSSSYIIPLYKVFSHYLSKLEENPLITPFLSFNENISF